MKFLITSLGRVGNSVLSTIVFFFLAGSGYSRLFEGSFSTSLHFDLSIIIEILYQLLFIYLLSLSRWIFIFTFPLLLVVGTAVNWYEVHLGIDIDRDVLGAIFVTDYSEVAEILSSDFLLHLAGSLLISIILVTHRFNVPPQLTKQKLKISVWLIAAVLGVVGVRYWQVPVQFVFHAFDLSVGSVPSGKLERDHLAKKLWLDSDRLNQKKSRKKGRFIYGVYNKNKHERLRLYASNGDFSITSELYKKNKIKRYYDRDGKHLKSRLILDKKYNKFKPNQYQPFFFLEQLQDQIGRQKRLFDASSNLDDIAQYPSVIDESLAKDLITVLIIGEAARADHFQLNGYSRHTNPKLRVLSGLINFPSVQSCAASTMLAIPCMVTRMRAEELPENIVVSDVKTYLYQPVATENSFVSLFSKHHFGTAWLSLNRIYGRKNTPISAMVGDAKYHKFLSHERKDYQVAMDGLLLPEFDTFMSRSSGRKLIILHTRGSHWRYSARYPAAFKKFKPTCTKNTPSKCEQQSLVNAYDNSILYTDYFINAIIDRLKGRKALVVYTSDHGESLGEEGIYTHSVMSRPEQRRVPMVWWASKQWQEDNPLAYSNLIKHSHRKISHDFLFHSLLDCSGIESDVVDKKLSLCRRLDITSEQ